MIDWVSLIIVAVVSIGVTALFALLLSLAIRLLSVSRTAPGGRSTGPAVGGWVLLGLIGGMVLVALYLIIPQFH